MVEVELRVAEPELVLSGGDRDDLDELGEGGVCGIDGFQSE